MTTITFTITYKQDPTLLLSPNTIVREYLFGVPLIDRKTNISYSLDRIEYLIRQAQEEVENWLTIKFFKQRIKEKEDFYREHWLNWGYVTSVFPISCPLALTGFLGTVMQTDYPVEWLATSLNTDDKEWSRTMYVVPTPDSNYNQAYLFAGIISNLGYGGNRQIPFYWSKEYVTGFNVPPAELIDYVAKLVAIRVLWQLNNALLPFPGVGSQSISIDGLSQSTSFIQGLFAVQINGYLQELKDKKSFLEDKYGNGFSVGGM